MLFLSSQGVPASPDVWQTFGLLAAFVAVVVLFLNYLQRKDKSGEMVVERWVKAMDDLEERSSTAHIRAAEICAQSERERNASLAQVMEALGRAVAVIERHEREV